MMESNRSLLFPIAVRVLPEADTKMELEVQEMCWGNAHEGSNGEEAGEGGESLQKVMQDP